MSQKHQTNTFPLFNRRLVPDIELSVVIQNAFFMLSLLITVAVLRVAFFCFSIIRISPADNLDTDSDSDSDEIDHNDNHHSENDEENDGDDETDYFLVFVINSLFSILFNDDEYSDEEDSYTSYSDEEDGHDVNDVDDILYQRWSS